MTLISMFEPASLCTDVVLWFRLRTPDTKAYTSFKNELRQPLKKVLAGGATKPGTNLQAL